MRFWYDSIKPKCVHAITHTTYLTAHPTNPHFFFSHQYTLPNNKNVKRGPYMQKGLITFQSIKVIGKRSGADQKFEFRWKRRPRALAQEQYSVILLFGGTRSIISSVESRGKPCCRWFFSDWRCVLSADRAAAATARWPGWRRRWRNRHHSPPPAPIMPASRYKFPAASYVWMFVCAHISIIPDLIGRTHLRDEWFICRCGPKPENARQLRKPILIHSHLRIGSRKIHNSHFVRE